MTSRASGNAALFLHPNGYDTSGPNLMGRHSAGESFLRGFLRYGEVERLYLWNVANRPQAELEALIGRIQPPRQPITWISQRDRPGLAAAGVLNTPMPDLAAESWQRRPFGPNTYAICGVTHTTATERVMGLLPAMLIAPTEPHDALICTSSAVRASVESQLDDVRAYLEAERGPRRRGEPMRVTIPLGVNVEDFETSPGQRQAWRARLDIPDNAVVALYVGRFNVRAKMNPALMALALERAAKTLGRPIYWVNSGWGEGPKAEAQFHAQTRALCPSVEYRHLDGRPPDVRFSIWSVADFFISFSDNIQETFGLTPVEAMAAGLPCVVSDWDGYRDTVRHGEDGFRIRTMAPLSGEGVDLAYWFANNWINYDNYVGAAAQFTMVDLAAAAEAIVALARQPGLRARMGAAAKAQARQVFDWTAVIPQYQALWAEQDARRRAAAAQPAVRDNPFRPDPFRLFAAYPTDHLSADCVLTPGTLTWSEAQALLASPAANYSQVNNMSFAEAEAILSWLQSRGVAKVAEARDVVPPGRWPYVRRGLLWLARYGVIAIAPPPAG